MNDANRGGETAQRAENRPTAAPRSTGTGGAPLANVAPPPAAALDDVTTTGQGSAPSPTPATNPAAGALLEDHAGVDHTAPPGPMPDRAPAVRPAPGALPGAPVPPPVPAAGDALPADPALAPLPTAPAGPAASEAPTQPAPSPVSPLDPDANVGPVPTPPARAAADGPPAERAPRAPQPNGGACGREPALQAPPRSAGDGPRGAGAAAAAAHLARLPLERVLRHAWVRLPRYGLGARIPGADLTTAERQALDGLLAERLPAGKDVPLRRLDDALRRSAFGCGLDQALGALLGPPPLPRSEAAARAEGAFAAFIASVTPHWPEAADEAGRVAPALRREFARAQRVDEGMVAQLARTAQAVGRALGEVAARARGAALPLPVLANRVAGDPHAFDAGTPGGRLLLLALGGRPGTGTTERQAVLAMAGIAPDGVSSTVAVWGIAGAGDAAAAAACASKQVYVAPLRLVARWELAPAAWRGRVVHAVENPAVFEALVDHGPPPGCALLCTSGFPSAAALTLLARLGAAGARVRYGGDFDGKGLLIARHVGAAAGETAALWRMAATDYRAALAVARGRPLRPEEDRALAEMAGATAAPATEGEGALAACAAALRAGGAVAYQEALLPVLWTDLVGQGD